MLGNYVMLRTASSWAHKVNAHVCYLFCLAHSPLGNRQVFVGSNHALKAAGCEEPERAEDLLLGGHGGVDYAASSDSGRRTELVA